MSSFGYTLILTIFTNLIGLVWFMVFSATFNDISVISWWSVWLVEETGVSGENHRQVTAHRHEQALQKVLNNHFERRRMCLWVVISLSDG